MAKYPLTGYDQFLDEISMKQNVDIVMIARRIIASPITRNTLNF